MSVRYEMQPLGQWDRPITVSRARSARFSASWESTLDLLGEEVHLLGGRLVVVQVDVKNGDVRRDGMLRSRAQVDFPGVKISFDSRHGPLTYATDAYGRWYSSDPPPWQANVRAIALALQALRAVDRYGVSASGEQYRGWTAIAATAAADAPMTPEQAAALLREGALHAMPTLSVAGIMRVPGLANLAFRHAAKAHHPDHGGDRDLFRRLTDARNLLVKDK